MTHTYRITYAALFSCIIVHAAQADPLDNEVKQLQGGWRITEMVENGRVMSASDMQHGLPGGGLIDIIDYTVIFKSPVSGVRGTRSFRIDPTSYPKQIVIRNGDSVTGVGIYQLDQGKFVVCVAAPNVPPPREFNAPQGSGRTLMVMTPQKAKQGDSLKSLPAPPTRLKTVSSNQSSIASTANQTPIGSTPNQTPIANANPGALPGASTSVAARILSDADVVRRLVGVWRLNDGEGLVDLTILADKTFSSYRHTQTMANFHSVFVAKPVSVGRWAVQRGQLTLTITSSWRSDRQNTQATFAVRSISESDAIIVDALGRVIKATKRL